MAHLCVPQNQALGVCRGFAPDVQIRSTHGREDLVNATLTSNAEEEEVAHNLVIRILWSIVSNAADKSSSDKVEVVSEL